MPSKLRMIALYDCTADDIGELSFKEGDILTDVTKSNDEGWYEGRLENSTERGLFPYNFVKPLPESFTVDTITTDNVSSGSGKITVSDSASTAFDTILSNVYSKKDVKSAKKTHVSATDKGLPQDLPEKSTNYNNKLGNGTHRILPMPADKTKDIPGLKFSTPPPTFEKLSYKSTEKQESPTRARSYSTSFLKSTSDNHGLDRTLRPSQWAPGGKSELEIALSRRSPRSTANLRSEFQTKHGVSTGTGIQLVGLENAKLSTVSRDTEEEEEDEGFQLIKPSQLRQKQQVPGPVLPKPIVPTQSASYVAKSSTPSWKKTVDTSQRPTESVGKSTIGTPEPLGNIPAPSNPMPRLPSRPVSTASRKSRNNSQISSASTPSVLNQQTPSLSKEERPESILEKANPPPILKPKPVLPQPCLPPRPNKARSASNPPLLQPKPNLTLLENSSGQDTKEINNTTQATSLSPPTPPRVGAKPPPVLYQQKLQSFISQKAISPPFSPPTKPTTLTPPSPPRTMLNGQKNSISNLKPSAYLNRARSVTNPPYFGQKPTMDCNSPKLTSIPKSSVETKVNSTELKKKVAPPPPPSRPPKSKLAFISDDAKARYEALFDAIHDDGYVDSQTVYKIWIKSKISKDKLARIWKESHPDQKGLLDRHAFVYGMGKIDEILKQHQFEQSV
ncbi:hypothetical protein RMATCC62417_07001 [Rhizopus microsporus]|nr:hypothetical protein RMATCC62417_07001 [Rhizopus microsporus]